MDALKSQNKIAVPSSSSSSSCVGEIVKNHCINMSLTIIYYYILWLTCAYSIKFVNIIKTPDIYNFHDWLTVYSLVIISQGELRYRLNCPYFWYCVKCTNHFRWPWSCSIVMHIIIWSAITNLTQIRRKYRNRKLKEPMIKGLYKLSVSNFITLIVHLNIPKVHSHG